jgi:hypothetical protein
MLQTAGKPVKKSSKTKSSSTSKRHFTVVIGTKEHGLYVSSSPSSAARKAVSKLCGKEKGKRIEFCLREITQGSKKKTYGPYLGHIEKIATPIQLKGRLVERKPVALLKPKSSAKKGGMRGGEIQDITVSLGNCGRLMRIGVWKNGCITLINNEKKVVLYYNENTNNIEIRRFDSHLSNIYDEKDVIDASNFTIIEFKSIFIYLTNSIITYKDKIMLIEKIIDFIDPNNPNFKNCLVIQKILKKILKNCQILIKLLNNRQIPEENNKLSIEQLEQLVNTSQIPKENKQLSIEQLKTLLNISQIPKKINN